MSSSNSPEQPPVDNAFVAPGCEQFGGQAAREAAEKPQYIIIATCESYETKFATEDNLLEVLSGVLFYDLADMPEDEREHWREQLSDEDNWRMREGKRVAFAQDIGETDHIAIYRLECFPPLTAALAEREAECERVKGQLQSADEREEQAIEMWAEWCAECKKVEQQRDTLAAEAERLRGELKDIWSAAFVDPDKISETMARNIVRVIRDSADKALKPQHQ